MIRFGIAMACAFLIIGPLASVAIASDYLNVGDTGTITSVALCPGSPEGVDKLTDISVRDQSDSEAFRHDVAEELTEDHGAILSRGEKFKVIGQDNGNPFDVKQRLRVTSGDNAGTYCWIAMEVLPKLSKH